jgi:hypothetical protein
MTNTKLQEAIDLLYECRDMLALYDGRHAELYKKVWEWCRANRNAAQSSEPGASLPPGGWRCSCKPPGDVNSLFLSICKDCGTVRPEPAEKSPPHTTEDDFRHFLSYSKLSGQPADELQRLRLAYYAGADKGLPEKSGGGQ